MKLPQNHRNIFTTVFRLLAYECRPEPLISFPVQHKCNRQTTFRVEIFAALGCYAAYFGSYLKDVSGPPKRSTFKVLSSLTA